MSEMGGFIPNDEYIAITCDDCIRIEPDGTWFPVAVCHALVFRIDAEGRRQILYRIPPA